MITTETLQIINDKHRKAKLQMIGGLPDSERHDAVIENCRTTIFLAPKSTN